MKGLSREHPFVLVDRERTLVSWRPQQPFPFMLSWAILMHLSWGVALIIDPGIASLVILVGLHWITALTPGPIFLGISDAVFLGTILISASVLALVGLAPGVRLSSRQALCLMLPQQFLLTSAFFSDAQTIITGMVTGDDRTGDRVLIFTVLFPVMIAAVLHTAALIERHSRWTPAR